MEWRVRRLQRGDREARARLASKGHRMPWNVPTTWSGCGTKGRRSQEKTRGTELMYSSLFRTARFFLADPERPLTHPLQVVGMFCRSPYGLTFGKSLRAAAISSLGIAKSWSWPERYLS
jgi:hypothetical protein